MPVRLPLELSVPLSVSLHTTSDQATEPLATLQDREMEMAVMALTTTFTCPGAGTKRLQIEDYLIFEGFASLNVTSTITGLLERD